MTDSKYKCNHTSCNDIHQLGRICPQCHIALYNKYQKLLEFVKESDFIDCEEELLTDLSKRQDDSYPRRQADYILQLKIVLREIGEI